MCGPASALTRLGPEVLAFELSPILAALAMHRLNRADDLDRSITLIEGAPESFSAQFTADLILMRSVAMLLNDADRATQRRTVCGDRGIARLKPCADAPWVFFVSPQLRRPNPH